MFYFLQVQRIDSVLKDVDRLHPQCPVSVIPFSSVSCLWGHLPCCVLLYLMKMSLNSWELELKIKPKLSDSLVCQ